MKGVNVELRLANGGLMKLGKTKVVPRVGDVVWVEDRNWGTAEQDYHRVRFTLPDAGAVYALTRRKAAATKAPLSADRVLPSCTDGQQGSRVLSMG